jgi:hypothetical protein
MLWLKNIKGETFATGSTISRRARSSARLYDKVYHRRRARGQRRLKLNLKSGRALANGAKANL